MNLTLLLAAFMLVSVTAQFLDAFTTYINLHAKKIGRESNRLAFIQWLVNKHPFLDMGVKSLVGAVPGIVGFILPTSDTALGIALGGSTALAATGALAAYHNFRLGK